MNADFEKCLKNGKITKFTRGRALAGKELRVAEEDLQTARTSFAQKG